MCGIFGFITKDGTRARPGPPAADRHRNATRGHHAFGLAWLGARRGHPYLQAPGPRHGQPGRPGRLPRRRRW